MALLRRPRPWMTVGLLSLAQLPPEQQTVRPWICPKARRSSRANRGLGKDLADQLISRVPASTAGHARPKPSTQRGRQPGSAGHQRSRLRDGGRGSRSRYHSADQQRGRAHRHLAPHRRPAHISSEFGTNFYGTLAMVRAFAGPIEGNGGGSILNVLSIVSWLTLPIAGAYSSAKTASWSMTYAIRLELAPHNITVSAL